MEYYWKTTILSWTADELVFSSLQHIAKGLNLNLWIAEVETDLYAVPYFLAVVDGDNISKDIIMTLKEIIVYEKYKEFGILVLGKIDIKIPAAIKKYFIQTEKGATSDFLKATILNKRYSINRHIKNNQTYDKKVFRVIYIFKKLMRPNELVKVEELCQEFNVSEKTILRDIAMLRSMGEEIVFDKNRKGYSLVSFE